MLTKPCNLLICLALSAPAAAQIDLVVQALVLDPTLPQSLAFTNAVRLRILP